MIIIIMNDILFYTLYTLIPTSFVSVTNSKTMSVYSVTIPDENGEETYINLCSYYSHTDPKNSYVAYELYIDDEMIARAIKPIFDRKPANPRQKKISTLTMAEKLEILLSLCSKKIIQQEYNSHSQHMLKTFMNEHNQNIS